MRRSLPCLLAFGLTCTLAGQPALAAVKRVPVLGAARSSAPKKLALAAPKPAAAPTRTPTATTPVGSATANDAGTTFSIAPQWGSGYRPPLLIAWNAFGPATSRISVTVTSADGSAPVTASNDAKSEFSVPAGLDPLVAHSLTATLEFANGKKVTAKAALPAAVVGPHPVNQNPTLPAGASLIGGRPNPCLTIHWKYNPDRELFNALPMFQQAFAQLSAANGITYVYDGTTTEYSWVKSLNSTALIQPNTVLRDWFLVQWEDPARANPEAGEATAGYAGPGHTTPAPGLVDDFSVGADLTMIGAKLAGAPEAVVMGVALHELGHSAGLGHTSDPTSIMTPAAKDVFTYGANDIALLNALGKPGSGGCVG